LGEEERTSSGLSKKAIETPYISESGIFNENNFAYQTASLSEVAQARNFLNGRGEDGKEGKNDI